MSVSVLTPKLMVIIAGPTAVGKTAVAIEAAKHFGTEIISADSRQCYRELNIGVARPSPEELSTVPHHFIASHSIHEPIDAAFFEQYALQKAALLFQKHEVLVMTGGTGLYIKAFIEGLDEIPEVPEKIHEQIIAGYRQNGLPWLQQKVKEKDPLFFEKGEVQNPQRMMRALEVVEATGKSLLDFRKKDRGQRPFHILPLTLEIPREDLYKRINHRVDVMMNNGLIEEVQQLQPYQHLQALQTVGYKELFSYFDNVTTLQKAVELIKQNTRRYAKRQLTWFRHSGSYHWLRPDSKVVIEQIEAKLRSIRENT